MECNYRSTHQFETTRYIFIIRIFRSKPTFKPSDFERIMSSSASVSGLHPNFSPSGFTEIWASKRIRNTNLQMQHLEQIHLMSRTIFCLPRIRIVLRDFPQFKIIINTHQIDVYFAGKFKMRDLLSWMSKYYWLGSHSKPNDFLNFSFRSTIKPGAQSGQGLNH